jgi:hypothetical protein
MKKLVTVLTFILASQSLFFAQTADEIIDKHLQAIGGKEKLKNLNSVVMEGKVNAQGMEFPMNTTIVNKKGFRLEFSVMGMDAWIVMRPDSGWSFMPFQGQTKPEAIPADQLKESVDRLDLSTDLCDYKLKGHTVEYLGMDDVEGTDCHKLKLVSKNGKLTYYLIDPKTYYIVKTISKEKAGGKEFDAETKFSNYKEVEGGYVFPHTIESGQGPLEIVKITINGKVDDSKFLLKS